MVDGLMTNSIEVSLIREVCFWQTS